MNNQDVVITIEHCSQQMESRLTLCARGHQAELIIPDWLCRCGKKHRVANVQILYASGHGVRIRTQLERSGEQCSSMNEEWVIPVTIDPVHLTSQEKFRTAVQEAIEQTLQYGTEHTFYHNSPRVIYQQADESTQTASWVVCEHVKNLEYSLQNNVPLWTKALFRYTLWQFQNGHREPIAHIEYSKQRP